MGCIGAISLPIAEGNAIQHNTFYVSTLPIEEVFQRVIS